MRPLSVLVLLACALGTGTGHGAATVVGSSRASPNTVVAPVHRLLQAILEIPAPAYYHHDLVCDEDGQRLAKRHDALSISELRQSGLSAAEILSYLPDFAESAIISSDCSVFSN